MQTLMKGECLFLSIGGALVVFNRQEMIQQRTKNLELDSHFPAPLVVKMKRSYKRQGTS